MRWSNPGLDLSNAQCCNRLQTGSLPLPGSSTTCCCDSEQLRISPSSVRLSLISLGIFCTLRRCATGFVTFCRFISCSSQVCRWTNSCVGHRMSEAKTNTQREEFQHSCRTTLFDSDTSPNKGATRRCCIPFFLLTNAHSCNRLQTGNDSEPSSQMHIAVIDFRQEACPGRLKSVSQSTSCCRDSEQLSQSHARDSRAMECKRHP